jgi:Tfp pilus assembly protein PilX
MSKIKRKNTIFKIRNHEEGVALIAAILTLLLLSAITAGIIILTNTETNTSSNFKDEQRAFFSAKAGIEEVRDRLRVKATGTLAGTSSVLPTALPGPSASGVTYILNPLGSETVAPWTAPTTSSPNPYADDEICKETTTTAFKASCTNGYPPSSGWYRSTSQPMADSSYAASPPLDWKWVRIQLKQSNGFGANYAVDGNAANAYYTCLKDGSPYEYAFSTFCTAPAYLPVYVLTALSVTPGGSRRMLQVEVGQDTFQFNAPAALTLDGPGDTFATGPSSKFGVNGNDNNSVCGGTAGPNVPSVGVPDDTDKTATITQIDNAVNGNTSKEGNYQSGSNTTPDVQNVYTGLPSTMQTKTSLTDLMSTIKADVTQPVINGPATDSSFTSPGSLGAPQIIYVNGDLTLSGNFTGYGILVVTGTFTAKGNNTWNGLIFVVGTGNFIDKGTSTFNGAVVVGNTTGTGTALSAPNVDVSGGGNGGVNYSSGCIVNATQLTTYHVISMRELLN